MDSRERWDDPEEALRVAIDGLRSGLWTAMPGIIQSFSASAVTATVQIAIKGVVHTPDGKAQFVNMPLLVDVPVHFPRGGGCTLTFPVANGDECLVVFAARCIDGWWQSGGIQPPAEQRIHDLSDGFAFVGFFSQATKIGGISTVSTQLRSNDGSTSIDLNPSNHKVTITAPGGFYVNAPQSGFSGTVIVQGLLSWLNGMTGSVVSGVASLITGTVQFVGSITSNGHAIDSTHQHTNSGGSGLGGPPQ
ncbi:MULTISPECIES: Gp138 family membrane-puncturing spike protein [unclassified Burkholderia]|uniref:Gp138 family membrane-puncturing spike protein n=1 Tax=unclassified Burkholderia TaxID=2613784 RepID=UPI000F56ED87|nr:MULTISPECIES: Gp138 family membrane-puncturing spike protein [unclassified Burkholderia]RQR87733.1 hypothetical protein DIE10_06515 [Burkholderia sp. Bp9011]RQR97076.1 hypothetical protein DIE09_06690 [Burkholderia sp. Bp9010]